MAVLLMLAILTILIIVHECGHFSVARLFGFQTPIFGFGLPLFGPYWTIGHKWGTEFRIHALLLGGYVAIPELGDESSSNKELEESGYSGVQLKPFKKFPIWQRALVAFAGVGFNIIFAYFVMIAMLAILGEPVQATIVHSLIKENPIAAQAGILPGDQIMTIDDQFVGSPSEAVKILHGHKNEAVKINIKRKVADKSESLILSMTTNLDGKVGMALIGKGPVTYHKLEDKDDNIAWLAAKKLWFLTGSMIDALGQMFTGMYASIFSGGKNASGQVVPGFQDIHGILAVIKIGADIARQDWSQLFLFTILISLDLAIINLMPWPGLDGSHLAFMAVEAVRGKPMNERAHGEIIKWGFVSLLLLMALVTFNDISAMVAGKLELKQGKKDKLESKSDAKLDQQEKSNQQTKPGTNPQVLPQPAP